MTTGEKNWKKGGGGENDKEKGNRRGEKRQETEEYEEERRERTRDQERGKEGKCGHPRSPVEEGRGQKRGKERGRLKECGNKKHELREEVPYRGEGGEGVCGGSSLLRVVLSLSFSHFTL